MRRALVVGVVFVALLGGCGDDGDAEGSEADAREAAGDGADGSAADAPGGSDDGGGAPAPTGTIPPPPDPTPAAPCDGAAVLCVDGGSGGDGDGSAGAPFATVGAAVEVAAPGATIQVASGTYDEAVVLTEVDGLTLLGGFPAAGDFGERDATAHPTTIQGTPDTSVISLVGSTGVRIEGLRITGGGGTTDGSTWTGGGIYIDPESSDVTIVGNQIDGNEIDQGDDPTGTVGGGIASNGSDVAIVANVVEGNRAGRGSGIAAAGTTTVDQNIVRDNVSIGDHGGGIYLFGEVTVTGNRVEGNTVGTEYSWGGGIIVYGDDTTATLQGNVVTGNAAVTAGSAVFVDDGADATLVDELYHGNECASQGGAGVLVDSGGETPTVLDATNVTIADHGCTEVEHGGNGILAMVSEVDDPPPEVTVTASIFWANGGSDVVSLGADVTVTDSVSEVAVDGDGVEGQGNTTDDPRFVDPEGGDFSLAPDSPAAGAGAGGA